MCDYLRIFDLGDTICILNLDTALVRDRLIFALSEHYAGDVELLVFDSVNPTHIVFNIDGIERTVYVEKVWVY